MLRLHSSSAQAHFLCDFKHRSTTNLPSFLHHSVTFAPRDHHKACFSEHPTCFARIARGYSTTVSLNQKPQLEFSRTKSSLQEAAANGCELCQSIYDGRFDDPFYTEKARAEHCRPVPVHDTEEVAHNLAFSYEGTNDIYPTVYILRDGKQAIPYWLVKLG